MTSKRHSGAQLPTDRDSLPVQTLAPNLTGTVHISAAEGASASAALPSGTEFVRIASSGAVWLAFGTSGVAAAASESDSMLFPGGAEVFYVEPTTTHVAARSTSGAGSLFVTATRME